MEFLTLLGGSSTEGQQIGCDAWTTVNVYNDNIVV